MKMVFNEETADFRKPLQISDKDYQQSRRSFIAAKAAEKPQMFLNYCFAVINQKNGGMLSIRESAYAISECEGRAEHWPAAIDKVMAEALSLRRHPSNYKEDHQAGWANLVKHISLLRKSI